MLEQVFRLIFSHDIQETRQAEQLCRRVADDPQGVLAHDSDCKLPSFLPQANQQAEALNGAGSMNRLIFASLQCPAVSTGGDGVAIVDDRMLEPSSHQSEVFLNVTS